MWCLFTVADSGLLPCASPHGDGCISLYPFAVCCTWTDFVPWQILLGCVVRLRLQVWEAPQITRSMNSSFSCSELDPNSTGRLLKELGSAWLNACKTECSAMLEIIGPEKNSFRGSIKARVKHNTLMFWKCSISLMPASHLLFSVWLLGPFLLFHYGAQFALYLVSYLVVVIIKAGIF